MIYETKAAKIDKPPIIAIKGNISVKNGDDQAPKSVNIVEALGNVINVNNGIILVVLPCTLGYLSTQWTKGTDNVLVQLKSAGQLLYRLRLPPRRAFLPPIALRILP